MSIASKDIFDPMKQAIGVDIEALLPGFFQDIQAAADNLTAKLPASTAPIATLGVNTFIGLAALLGTSYLHNALAGTTAAAAAPAPTLVQG